MCSVHRVEKEPGNSSHQKRRSKRAGTTRQDFIEQIRKEQCSSHLLPERRFVNSHAARRVGWSEMSGDSSYALCDDFILCPANQLFINRPRQCRTNGFPRHPDAQAIKQTHSPLFTNHLLRSTDRIPVFHRLQL